MPTQARLSRRLVMVASSLLTCLLLILPAARSQETLPPLQSHPLPPSLLAWQDTAQGDYFDQIRPTSVGYLVWSRFPVTVFIEPSSNSTAIDRAAEWVDAVEWAVQDWSTYLPLALTDSAERADIRIWRRSPPLQGWGAQLQRVRSAETRYELYVDQQERLSHRCDILLRPHQTAVHIQAAARHELGHALGIWGHSPVETDALYFAQVRHPVPISARDINTLKRVYEQPTRLGWVVTPSVNPSVERQSLS